MLSFRVICHLRAPPVPHAQVGVVLAADVVEAVRQLMPHQRPLTKEGEGRWGEGFRPARLQTKSVFSSRTRKEKGELRCENQGGEAQEENKTTEDTPGTQSFARRCGSG